MYNKISFERKDEEQFIVRKVFSYHKNADKATI